MVQIDIETINVEIKENIIKYLYDFFFISVLIVLH